MELIGYLCAILIGVVLGLLGGGGSILTVPIFVYILGVSPILATSYSLFVVGFTAMVGVYKNYKKSMVDVKTGVVFAVPAFIGVFIARKFLLPKIPNEIISVSNFLLTKDIMIMLLFSVLMFIAAFFMIKGQKEINYREEIEHKNFLLVFDGLIIGILTGIVGAGGGFLIIPALVFFTKLSMKKAVATSLMIISLKSLVGFTGDLGQLKIDWLLLISFTAISVIGIFIGIYFNQFIQERQLKRGFGYFILTISILIIFNELI